MKVMVVSFATYADPDTRGVFERVADMGVEVLLLMPRQPANDWTASKPLSSESARSTVRVERLDTWHSHPNGTHVALKGLRNHIRTFRPNVIHCVVEPWSIACLQILAFLAATRPRPIFGVHAAETRLMQGSRISGWIRRCLYGYVLRRCDFFVGWNAEATHLALAHGMGRGPVTVTPAVGVDPDLFSPPPEELRIRMRESLWPSMGDAFLIGFVGRFVEEKGVDTLLRAADIAHLEQPRIRLALLGTGPLLPMLQRAATMRHWMRLFAMRNRGGVSEFMKPLDILVLPSTSTARVAEQFGLVLPEAMASGVPVIGTSTGAIPEVIGGAGWLVPERSAEALAEVFLHASRATSERHDLALRGREHALAKYSESAVASRLVHIWQGAG